MGVNDQALFTAAKGYIFRGAPGTAAPTAAQVAGFDPATFGGEQQTVTMAGSASTLTYSGQTTSSLATSATAQQVQTALEALSNIAPGDVTVSGPTGGPFIVQFSPGFGDPATMTASTATVSVTSAYPGWVNIGHTSREDLPEFGFDGGDTETRGTWQNAAVKEVITDVTVDYVTMNLHQFDEDNLELYYSQENNASAPVNQFWVTDAATATLESALLIVIVDGAAKIAFYARKASVRREEAIGMEVDNFAVLPVRATFLKDGNYELYRWISTTIPVNPA